MKTPVVINERISKKLDIGECHGIITDTDSIDFRNYSAFDYWLKNREELGCKYNRVSLIDMIKVHKGYRENGYGKKLIEIIIEKSKLYKSEAIILMVDTLVQNSFDLINWYERQGFYIHIGRGQDFPIMIMEI